MGEGWKVSTQIREHLLVIEQHTYIPTVGNEGANPLDTFVFLLAGCISTKMVAREQNIALKQFDLAMTTQIDSAGLLGKSSDDPISFKVIDIIATMGAVKEGI